MQDGSVQPGPFVFRPSGRHVVAGITAVLVSVALHVVVVRVAPPIPVGKTHDLQVTRKLRAIEMGDVRRIEPVPVERPSRFRPEAPGEFVDVSLTAEEFDAAVAGIFPETPDMAAQPLAADDRAMQEEPPAPERARWEPRQDVLAIEKATRAEEVSVLPRRFEPAIPRVPVAPDIVLPTDTMGDISGVPLAPTADLVSNLGDTVMPAVSDAGAAALEGGVGDPLPGARWGAPASLLDERPEEVSPLEAVEDILKLQLATYTPSDDPLAVYFKIHIERKGADALPVLPKDVLLMQDCSESMTQAKLDACKMGLHAWLDRLRPDDRFELVGFREDTHRCFGAWTNLVPATRARANWFIRNMTARGKTDVFTSLQSVAAMERTQGRPVIAVLVTDGRPTMGMVDSSDIIEEFTRVNDGGVSVFGFGGGRRVNRYLLDFLSYKNRGDSELVRELGDIPEGLNRWAGELSRPVLVDLSYRFAGLPEDDIYPRTLTHLYLDRPLTIYGRAKRPLPKVAFQVVGHSGEERRDMVFTLPWETAAAGGGDIRGQWAWQKVYHLIGEHIRTRDASVLDKVRALAAQYGLAVPYLSR